MNEEKEASSDVLRCSGLHLSVQRAFVLSVCLSSSCPSNKAFQKLSRLTPSGLKGRKVPTHVDLFRRNCPRSLDRAKRSKQMICSADVKYQP